MVVDRDFVWAVMLDSVLAGEDTDSHKAGRKEAVRQVQPNSRFRGAGTGCVARKTGYVDSSWVHRGRRTADRRSRLLKQSWGPEKTSTMIVCGRRLRSIDMDHACRRPTRSTHPRIRRLPCSDWRQTGRTRERCSRLWQASHPHGAEFFPGVCICRSFLSRFDDR